MREKKNERGGDNCKGTHFSTLPGTLITQRLTPYTTATSPVENQLKMAKVNSAVKHIF